MWQRDCDENGKRKIRRHKEWNELIPVAKIIYTHLKGKYSGYKYGLNILNFCILTLLTNVKVGVKFNWEVRKFVSCHLHKQHAFGLPSRWMKRRQ